MGTTRIRAAFLGACLAVASIPADGWAVTEQHFHVRTTEDLINLCATPPSDPLHVAAVNFCEGFVVGAYQYHNLSVAAEGRAPLVCPPSPPPTRDENVLRFIEWGRSHSAVMEKPPVAGMFEFLAERFPCRG